MSTWDYGLSPAQIAQMQRAEREWAESPERKAALLVREHDLNCRRCSR